MLVWTMLLGTAMVVATIVFHVVALVYLAGVLPRLSQQPYVGNRALMSFSVLFILTAHTVEIWVWAGLYLLLGEFSSLETALYFSAVTATTLGYGDVVLSPMWQLLSAFEAVGGLMLFGVSTAFLIALVQRVFLDTTRARE